MEMRFSAAKPLFVSGSPGERAHDPRNTRDLTLLPQSIRESTLHRQVHKTAEVKQPLLSKAAHHECQTTYEHDFGIRTRSKPCTPARSSRSSIGQRLVEVSPAKIVGHATMAARNMCWGLIESSDGNPPSERTSQSSCARRGVSAATRSSSLDPLNISVRGYGNTRWSPKTHPWMVQSLTDKQIHLKQACDSMHLRSSDIPFSTR